MKVSRFPQPLAWSLVGAATFWLSNVWSLYALNVQELTLLVYFGSRYFACVLAAVPMAIFGNVTGRGFATLFVLPCIAVFHAYFIWNSNGALELWPPLAVADLLGFFPALLIFSVMRKRAAARYLWC